MISSIYLWLACIKYKQPVSFCSERRTRKDPGHERRGCTPSTLAVAKMVSQNRLAQHLVVDHHFSFRQFFEMLRPYFSWIIHHCSPGFMVESSFSTMFDAKITGEAPMFPMKLAVSAGAKVPIGASSAMAGTGGPRPPRGPNVPSKLSMCLSTNLEIQTCKTCGSSVT